MKKIGIIVFSLFIGVSIWYLFLKTDDYQVSFKVKGTSGGTYHHILNWKLWGEGVKDVINTKTVRYQKIQQQVVLKDTILQVNWTLENINDSITQVRVNITSGKHSLSNRIKLLTGETPFTIAIKKALTNFNKAVNAFENTFSITIDGIAQTPDIAYVKVATISNRNQKAGFMIHSNIDIYPKISDYIDKKNHFPLIKVRFWDQQTDSIQFDFGFPVKKLDSIPVDSQISYGTLLPEKALKATFYGNYSKTDQAWFALMEYAKKNAIHIDPKPLEIFYDNPMSGTDDRKWKAEIFMPIKSK